MLLITSTECRAIKKLAETGRDERHRRRLTKAAEGWLFVASQLRGLEKSLECEGPKRRSEPSQLGVASAAGAENLVALRFGILC